MTHSVRSIGSFLSLVCVASVASGQEATEVGRDPGGLPAIADVGVWAQTGRSLTLAGTAGYGYTEAVVPGDGPHHRGVGRLAVSLIPTESVQLSLRFDGRVDAHAPDSEGKDTGLVGDPWLVARTGLQLTEGFGLGAELGAWFPGSNAPSVEFRAATAEAKLLATLNSNAPLVVAAVAGFRLDRSDKSVAEPDLLRRGDRIALGVSEFNAALLGLGVDYRVHRGELLGSVTADLLLGASRLSTSPLRASAGYRHHLSPALQLETLVTTSLSRRPQLGNGSELIPIEPRLLATAGLRYVFDLEPRREPKPEPRPRIKAEPVAEPEAPLVVAAPVFGEVTDEAGSPLAQVTVSLYTGNQKTFEVTTDANGRYQFQSVPFGTLKLKAETTDFAPAELEFLLDGDGKAVELPKIQLRLAVLRAQVRGLVRSFSGEPLTATIRIVPPGSEHTSSGDGRFAIDVKPGQYTVTIQAQGYEPQKRTVIVDEKGVIVFNADLRKQE